MRVTLLFLLRIVLCFAQAPFSKTGQAIVVNKCNFPVYFESVGNSTPPVHSIAPNSLYRETFQLRPILNTTTHNVTYAGISIMLSPNQSISLAADKSSAFDESTITQFEYTYDPTKSPGLWYDISNVNGYVRTDTNGWNGVLPWPFQDGGLILESTSSTCPAVNCPGGNPYHNSSCAQAYTHSQDDYATHACSNNSSLVLTLCTTISSLDEIRTGEVQYCRQVAEVR